MISDATTAKAVSKRRAADHKRLVSGLLVGLFGLVVVGLVEIIQNIHLLTPILEEEMVLGQVQEMEKQVPLIVVAVAVVNVGEILEMVEMVVPE